MAVLARKDCLRIWYHAMNLSESEASRRGREIHQRFLEPQLEGDEVLSDYAEWTSDQTFGEIASGRRVS